MMSNSMHNAAAAAALAGFLGLGCGGENLVTGIGNGGSRIYASQLDQVVEVLAESSAVPQISDDQLRGAFDAIARRAGDGDPEAVMVLFRVAAEQRESKRE
jgi:hypothetical protein